MFTNATWLNRRVDAQMLTTVAFGGVFGTFGTSCCNTSTFRTDSDGMNVSPPSPVGYTGQGQAKRKLTRSPRSRDQPVPTMQSGARALDNGAAC